MLSLAKLSIAAGIRWAQIFANWVRSEESSLILCATQPSFALRIDLFSLVSGSASEVSGGGLWSGGGVEEGDSVVAPLGFTPAFGRVVGSFGAGWFLARLKPCPFEDPALLARLKPCPFEGSARTARVT
jgi:hypothetical protein